MSALWVFSRVTHGFVSELKINGHELPTPAAYPLAGLLPFVFYVPLGGLALLLSRPLAVAVRNVLSGSLLVLVILGLLLRLRW
jgi:hypothetical protein